MTSEDIIRMAREAGWEMGDDLSDGFGVRLERFAELVAAAQEPVTWVIYKDREWQGMTDEERNHIIGSVPGGFGEAHVVARAIEAKLKEKNCNG